ncbi:MAG: CDP-4-dehydro-6-deoxyglucose reductase [Planctomycetota bacterium]|jgi:CDP-4-dehydro-6-deoxyglucose reductase
MSGSVQLGERTIELAEGETVLEALERAEVDVPSGCRSGTCTKCMLQADGTLPAESQRGLRPTLKAQGFFLACQARPTTALRLRELADLKAIDVSLIRIESVASDVVRIFLTKPEGMPYRAGQYVDVLHPGGETRSYSIASLPSDAHLELHVRLVPGGLLSGWLHGLQAGADLQVRGPFGQCFHIADNPEQKLLLVGTGTGLAPLLGIARDALVQGHQGPIDLIHGGLQPDRLYMRDELEVFASEWSQLRIHHCVLRGSEGREFEGPLDEIALRVAGPVDKTRAFLCGDDVIVRLLQRSFFMAGVPSGEIFADPFLPANQAQK